MLVLYRYGRSIIPCFPVLQWYRHAIRAVSCTEAYCGNVNFTESLVQSPLTLFFTVLVKYSKNLRCVTGTAAVRRPTAAEPVRLQRARACFRYSPPCPLSVHNPAFITTISRRQGRRGYRNSHASKLQTHKSTLIDFIDQVVYHGFRTE